MSTPDFYTLLDGVVFALSGFVNPERSTLRSQALEMGAEYRADWSSDCTLLVCAFRNTPKFRQVEADNRTIVSKEWILECYDQRKLVEIDRFLMHAGKPWRKNNSQLSIQGPEKSPGNPQKQAERSTHATIDTKTYVGNASDPLREYFSTSELKGWAVEDLNKTISWLESQEERPEPGEMKKIAAEGILTCLEDAIKAVEENKDIRHVTEQWRFVPRVVEKLAKLEDGKRTKEEISSQARACRNVYKLELDNLVTAPTKRMKMSDHGKQSETNFEGSGYDSDETIVMTEEEINQACSDLSCMN